MPSPIVPHSPAPHVQSSHGFNAEPLARSSSSSVHRSVSPAPEGDVIVRGGNNDGDRQVARRSNGPNGVHAYQAAATGVAIGTGVAAGSGAAATGGTAAGAAVAAKTALIVKAVICSIM